MPTALAIALKVFVLVGLGAIAAGSLRRVSAALRHRLWVAVLASVALVALTSPLGPRWTLPLGATLRLPSLDRIAADVHRSGTTVPAAGSSSVPLASSGEAWARATRLVWLLGAGALLLRLVVGHARLGGIARRARTIDSGPVRLVTTAELDSPATWGVFRPIIALPSGAASWSEVERADVMAHELAHVRRRDVLTQTCADVLCAALWLHPAVWYARGRLRAEGERACDDAVLAAGGDGMRYAETLFAIARRARPVAAAVGIGRARELEARLRAVLDPRVLRQSSRGAMTAIPLGVIAAASAIAACDVFALPEAVITYGERVPLTLEHEQRALRRHFTPRDAREAEAIERFQGGTGHVKQHEMDYVRDRSIWALSIARDDQIIAPLLARLDDADWRVRAYAAWGLLVADAHEAQGALTERLDDPIWRVRAMAAEALVALGDGRSTAAMVRLLEDPAWQVRLPVVNFLAKLDRAEADALIRNRLQDPHIAVRVAAARALGDSRTE